MGRSASTRWMIDGRWRSDAVLALFARMVPNASDPINRFVPRPPLSSAQLRDGAAAFGVALPADIAAFVEQVGDACPGPGHGLWPVGPLEEPDASVRQANARLSMLTIAEYGGGMFWHVRLDDAGLGEVWIDDGRGGRSLAAPSFDEWYCAWLDIAAASAELLDVEDGDAAADQELAEIWREAIAPSPESVDLLVPHLAAISGARAAAALRALVAVDPELAHGAARANLDADDRGLRYAAQDVIRTIPTFEDLPSLEARLLDERYVTARPAWEDPDRERLFHAAWVLADRAVGEDQPAAATRARELMARLSMTTMLGHVANSGELRRFQDDMAAWRAGGEPADYIRDDMQRQLDQVRGALRDYFDDQTARGGPGIPQELRDMLDDD